MSVATTWKYSNSTGDTATQTKTSTSQTFAAGSRVLAVAFAIPNGHGDSYLMGMSSSAVTNTVTWTTLATGPTNTYDNPGYPAKLVVFISSVLTATESFTVTVDFHTGNTQTYYAVLGVAEITGFSGSLAQAMANGSDNYVPPYTATANLGSTPSGYQLLIGGAVADAPTWGSLPSGFSLISGSNSGEVGGMSINVAESNTNTATGLTWTFTTSGEGYALNLMALELEASGGGSPTSLVIPKRRLLTRI